MFQYLNIYKNYDQNRTENICLWENIKNKSFMCLLINHSWINQTKELE